MSDRIAHYMRKPVMQGAMQRTLCGVMHTPRQVPPPLGVPVCRACADAYSKLAATPQVWLSNNTWPRPRPEFAISA